MAHGEASAGAVPADGPLPDVGDGGAAGDAGGALLFDGEFLAKLERLELVARKIFRGALRGEHSAPRRGRGLEFADYRPYQPGDDIRYIDWNIFSRLDHLFLKLYASDEDLTLHVALDASASMGFGRPAKFDQARRLAAALAYIGLSHLDRVGITAYAERPRHGLGPIRGKRQIAAVLRFLLGLRCEGPTRVAASMRELATRIRHPALVMVIGDFLGDDARPGLDALRHRGHEVVALQVLAEEEVDPPLDGALRLIDAEDGGELTLVVDAELRRLYHRRLGARLEALERHCASTGVEYLRATTAVPFEDLVLRYLREGAHLR